MPVIRVEMFKGRTKDQKREMVKELTDSFIKTCGGTPESVHIVITDVDMEDWGVAGDLCADKYG